jgi:hypothetical protein
VTLIVEDGTGLSNAESYVSAQDYADYVDSRGATAGDDDTVERYARQASEYADTYKRIKGLRLTTTQALEFPRTGLYNWSGQEVTGIPRQLKLGVCYLIAKQLDGETLYQDLDRGGMIKSETVGPLSTTYMDGAPTQKVYAAFDQLMQQFYGAGLPPTPAYTGEVRSPTFSIGMMDDGSPPEYADS